MKVKLSEMYMDTEAEDMIDRCAFCGAEFPSDNANDGVLDHFHNTHLLELKEIVGDAEFERLANL